MSRATQLLRRHGWFATLTGLAVALRLVVMLAYQPAFWFYGDSGSFIERAARGLDPYNTGGLGYIMALKVLAVTQSFAVVAALQHLTGVAIAIAIYALLQRRGLPRWLSCLAAAPMLFDPMEIVIEHYVLSETLFTVLAFAGIALLLWQKVPSVWACAAAGLALMMSWFTRPSTVGVVAVLLVYLAVRRVGWLRLAAFAAAFALPYAAAVAWIGERPSAYGDSMANRALYSRVAAWVDCDRLRLTPQEARLCPAEPLGLRHDRADWYGWNGPALAVPIDDNAVLRSFALKAIKAQPGDYAAAVGRELVPHFVPGATVGPEHTCLRGRYDFPESIRGHDIPTSCAPGLTQAEWKPEYADTASAPQATALTRALHAYSRLMLLPPLVTTVGLLLVLAAIVVRRRRGAELRDAVMLAFVTGALIVPSVLVGMYEARYGLPALPIAGVMAAFALHHLIHVLRSSPSRPPEENGEQATAFDAAAVGSTS